MALAVVLGLVGCGGSDDGEESSSDGGAGGSATTQATIPAGYIEVKDAGAGFAVAVPQDWQQIPLNAETLRRQADAVRAQNPKLAETLAAAQGLIGGGGKLFAIHPDGSSNVNLIVTDSGGAQLEDIPGPAIRELRSRGATIESQERTSLGGEDAVKVTMKFPVTAQETVHEVQYYAVKRGKAFILTLTGHDPALEVIAQSLHLT
ncbi:MAG TPA: hypothetical protein VHH09_04675 [Acidimicrobiales bacterium]|nr:hypothetical protein [Acidimicrobiales bacterium]